jgi:hypothetical protein
MAETKVNEVYRIGDGYVEYAMRCDCGEHHELVFAIDRDDVENGFTMLQVTEELSAKAPLRYRIRKALAFVFGKAPLCLGGTVHLDESVHNIAKFINEHYGED